MARSRPWFHVERGSRAGRSTSRTRSPRHESSAPAPRDPARTLRRMSRIARRVGTRWASLARSGASSRRWPLNRDREVPRPARSRRPIVAQSAIAAPGGAPVQGLRILLAERLSVAGQRRRVALPNVSTRLPRGTDRWRVRWASGAWTGRSFHRPLVSRPLVHNQDDATRQVADRRLILGCAPALVPVQLDGGDQAPGAALRTVHSLSPALWIAEAAPRCWAAA